MRRVQTVGLAVTCVLVLASAAGAKVLRVGSYHGIKGQYSSIQAAVAAAQPGDWILVGPGDYKTSSSQAPSDAADHPAGVLITRPNLRLRGMNRNTVIVDGTKAGPACSNSQADQNFGPSSANGPLGLNGIMVWKADDVRVQNLTACNFLGGSGTAGNEVWWNGGDGSGTIGGWGYNGSYLTATSTYYQDEATAAEYGIFSSNWDGGTWYQDYTSNFNDSGFYIGACQNQCNQTVDHVWSEYSAIGYSGSNSGGNLVVENSQWDNNQDGFDTNSQNGDNPPPQDGACPNGGISPITHTHSCWVFANNYVHDNNDPNVPTAGTAGGTPVGTGMSLSGARDDTVMNNRFVNNIAWGTIIVPYPDQGPPCTGGTSGPGGQPACLFDPWGDAILNNTYTNNGSLGNPSNGDIAWTSFEADPTNCFSGNTDTSGNLTTTPSNAQQTYPACNGQTVPPGDANPQGAVFTEEAACDATLLLPLVGKAPCLPSDHYPRQTQVVMHPLPPASQLQTMPNPCAGVPANPWCTAKAAAKTHRRKKHRRHRAAKRISRPRRIAAGFTG
ncbi:MAG: hypothetical protein JO244_11675 [Solirubrobacterales bacterium]|nr:hypothetical protein [Solirubrobacterales bacterium]